MVSWAFLLFANQDPCAAAIAAAILSILLSIGTALYRKFKASKLLSKRLDYSYPELSNNYELWSKYVNPFLEESKRLNQEEFNKTTQDTKINLLMTVD